jgi:hypothetical protein
MRRKTLLLSALCLITSGLLNDSTGFAQRPVLRTPPNQFGRPPIYDLFQQRRGILPNYYQYYLPQQQLQRNLRTQQYQMQRQGSELQTLQNQWLVPEQNRTNLAPTGRGSNFMNYSHFYPGLSSRR